VEVLEMFRELEISRVEDGGLEQFFDTLVDFGFLIFMDGGCVE
jgi:hypothetical protein